MKIIKESWLNQASLSRLRKRDSQLKNRKQELEKILVYFKSTNIFLPDLLKEYYIVYINSALVHYYRMCKQYVNFNEQKINYNNILKYSMINNFPSLYINYFFSKINKTEVIAIKSQMDKEIIDGLSNSGEGN